MNNVYKFGEIIGLNFYQNIHFFKCIREYNFSRESKRVKNSFFHLASSKESFKYRDYNKKEICIVLINNR